MITQLPSPHLRQPLRSSDTFQVQASLRLGVVDERRRKGNRDRIILAVVRVACDRPCNTPVAPPPGCGPGSVSCDISVPLSASFRPRPRVAGTSATTFTAFKRRLAPMVEP
jgi:hypothetical protein